MATQVSEEKEITLQDEDATKVTIRPLVIKRLRKFMKVIDKLNKKQKDDDAFIDVLMDAASLCLEPKLKKDKTTEQFKEYLEDSLDTDTVYDILLVCGGVDLRVDPNQIAALVAAQKTVEDGKTSTS